MHIARIEVTQVRSLRSVAIELDPAVNLFYGQNGAGKTALLEAVHLLAVGRSFRSGGPARLITHGEPLLRVRVQMHDGLWLAVERHRDGQVLLRRGPDAVQRVSELAQELPVILILPEAGELVFGGPSERRRALDWGLFHVEQSFRGLARDYAQALRQRNALLRRAQLAGLSRSTDLGTWTRRVAELGEATSQLRQQYVDRLRPRFDEVLGRLSEGMDLAMHYAPGYPMGVLIDQLQEDLEREVKLGVTQAGPHRADLKIVHKDRAAGSVLSRGQGKIAALAIRLAQAADLRDQGRHRSPPVFLIDDVGAELDDRHNHRLFEFLERLGCQVMATSAMTGLSWPDNWKTFHVEQGQVESA